MELLMPYLNTLSKIQRKKRPFQPKTSKFCTACSSCWSMPASQASTPQPSYHHSTKSSFMAYMSCLNYGHFGTHPEPNEVMETFTKSSLVRCVWGSRSYKSSTLRLRKSKPQGCRKAGKKLTEYSTTKRYLICEKSSILSRSVGTTMTFL